MLIAALLFAAQPIAVAETDRTKTTYRAHRSPLCSEWSAVRNGGGAARLMEAAYNNWFHGYVSGFNVYWHPRSGNILGQATWNEIAAFIDVECGGNPTKSVAQALDPLMTDLIKRQAHEKKGMPRPSVLTVQVTCRQWSDAKDDKVLRVFWGGAARGYLTAYNRWGRDTSGDFLLQNNDELIDRWINDWCEKRSSSSILQSMDPFIKYIDKERAAGRINPGSMPANELVVPIT